MRRVVRARSAGGGVRDCGGKPRAGRARAARARMGRAGPGAGGDGRRGRRSARGRGWRCPQGLRARGPGVPGAYGARVRRGARSRPGGPPLRVPRARFRRHARPGAGRAARRGRCLPPRTRHHRRAVRRARAARRRARIHGHRCALSVVAGRGPARSGCAARDRCDRRERHVRGAHARERVSRMRALTVCVCVCVYVCVHVCVCLCVWSCLCVYCVRARGAAICRR